MINEQLFIIKNDKMLYNFLKYHSYYYKRIYRGETNIVKNLMKDMKEEYKLTTKDKIEDISNKITMVRNILEIFN